jgi:hypothetical protein
MQKYATLVDGCSVRVDVIVVDFAIRILVV